MILFKKRHKYIQQMLWKSVPDIQECSLPHNFEKQQGLAARNQRIKINTQWSQVKQRTQGQTFLLTIY